MRVSALAAYRIPHCAVRVCVDQLAGADPLLSADGLVSAVKPGDSACFSAILHSPAQTMPKPAAERPSGSLDASSSGGGPATFIFARRFAVIPARMKIAAAIAEVEHIETAEALLAARAARGRHLPDTLDAEPVWLILLALMVSAASERSVCTADLIAKTGAPGPTVKRWLQALESELFVTRRADPADQRRVFVELTPRAMDSMQRCLSEIARRRPTVTGDRAEARRLAAMAAELSAALEAL